jgi:uridylate kinase
MAFEETIIIKLGGSIIVPNGGVNTKFLKEFNKFIRRQIAEYNRRFFIVAGGGATARNYITAGSEIIGEVTQDDLDWLGIHATRLNAHFIRTVFRDIAHPRVIDRYDRIMPDIVEPVIIGSGWEPGWSADYCAVLLAKMYNSRTLIKMGNIDMVYTKDPRKHSDAVPIERTTWSYFRKLAGDKWTPGLNIPIDPVAAKEAQKIGLTVIILKGTDFKNTNRLLSGKSFRGTVISPFRLDASFYDKEYFEEGIGYKGYTTSLFGRFSANLANLYRAAIIRLFLNPKTVLDVGCATGLLVKYLRLFGIKAKGVEISKYALSRADRKVRKYLKFGDVLKIPYKDREFDLVATFNVLEHIESESLAEAIAECNRVSSKYSLHKVFTTENWWTRAFHGKDLSHVSVFNKKWWEKLFSENKFRLSKRFFLSLGEKMETYFLLEK